MTTSTQIKPTLVFFLQSTDPATHLEPRFKTSFKQYTVPSPETPSIHYYMYGSTLEQMKQALNLAKLNQFKTLIVIPAKEKVREWVSVFGRRGQSGEDVVQAKIVLDTIHAYDDSLDIDTVFEIPSPDTVLSEKFLITLLTPY